MAAKRASSTDRDRLRTMAEAPGPHALSDHMEFHAQIAHLSGNGLMALFLGSLRDIVAEAAVLTEPPEQTLDMTKRAHIQIAKAIALGNEASARRAMQRHLDTCIEDTHAYAGPSEPIVSLARLNQEPVVAG